MTYIRNVPKDASSDEVVSVRLQNCREWLEDAKRQGYKSIVPIAFAIQELASAVGVRVEPVSVEPPAYLEEDFEALDDGSDS